jgi:CelD/BcsL family acetyltransferase involved in cellulose biosynthesis
MSYSVTEESLDQLNHYWQESHHQLNWEPLFVLPPWLKVWQAVFAPTDKTSILAVRRDDKIIGIAPLLIKDNVASIIGSPDVCDYVDFLVAPGTEKDFCQALLDDLKQKRIKSLEPGVNRPDSRVMTILAEMARQSGCQVTVQPDEVSLEKDLPATWEDYLQTLDSKQRHEVRRKLRRLEEAGEISYRLITDTTSLPQFMDIFLKMFVESRDDKAVFLTQPIETFFRSIVLSMAETSLLRAGILELDGKPVATLVAFDYNDTLYLYNSGYDPQYSYLSVGILSKALLIKDSIERGKKKFDFLKGGERYKYHLGGKEIRLQKYRIVLR